MKNHEKSTNPAQKVHRFNPDDPYANPQIQPKLFIVLTGGKIVKIVKIVKNPENRDDPYIRPQIQPKLFIVLIPKSSPGGSSS
jgi:hypothetical protein